MIAPCPTSSSSDTSRRRSPRRSRPTRPCRAPASSAPARRGIAAAKALYCGRDPVRLLRAGSVIGGNWVFDNPNGQSACYETLEINTSCPRMAFSDFPMPEDYPPYARARPGRRLLQRLRRPLRLPRPDHLRHHGRRGHPRRRRHLAGPHDRTGRRAGPDLRRGARRQRPPLGRALAGPGIPRGLRRRADPRARLPLERAAGRPRRRRRGFGQLRAGHLRRGREGGPHRPPCRVRRGQWVLRKFLLGKPCGPGRPARAGCRGG